MIKPDNFFLSMKLLITESQYKRIFEDDFDYETKIWELLRSGQRDNVKLAMEMSDSLGYSIANEIKSAGFEALSSNPSLKSDDYYQLIANVFSKEVLSVVLRSDDLQKVDGKVPKALKYLKPFETLSINNVGITEAPEVIGDLTFLAELDLAHNLLSDLPDNYANLSNLVELNLDNNAFYGIPEAIYSMKHLRWLDLSNNMLDSVDEILNLVELESKGSLQELYLGGNAFSTENEEQIISAFKTVHIDLEIY